MENKMKYFVRPVWDFFGLANTLSLKLTPLLFRCRFHPDDWEFKKWVTEMYGLVHDVDIIKQEESIPNADFFYRGFVDNNLQFLSDQISVANQLYGGIHTTAEKMRPLVLDFYTYLSAAIAGKDPVSPDDFLAKVTELSTSTKYK